MDRKQGEVEITEPENIFPRTLGRQIVGYEINTDGLHMDLSDGSTLIILGVVCLMPPQNGLQ